MCQRKHRRNPIGLALTLLLMGSAVFGAAPDCQDAETAEPNASVHRFHRSSTSAVFILSMTAGGVLDLDLVAAVDAPSLALLTFLGTQCPPTTASFAGSVVHRTPSNLRIQLFEPSDLYVAVSSQDPEEALGEYVLHSFFEPNSDDQHAAWDKDVDPIEDDEVAGFAPNEDGFETGPDASWLELLALDEKFSVRQSGFDLCSESPDDHSDRAACGTLLKPGAFAGGIIDNVADLDSDVFVFSLENQETLALKLVGAEGVQAILLDAAGQQLATWLPGKLVRTLGPGNFWVRVGSTEPWGDYGLALTKP